MLDDEKKKKDFSSFIGDRDALFIGADVARFADAGFFLLQASHRRWLQCSEYSGSAGVWVESVLNAEGKLSCICSPT